MYENHRMCYRVLNAGLSAALLAITVSASAQTFPAKPIRVVIGFAPGGPADLSGRLVAPKLGEALGQTVIIENRGGAGGTIGMEMVAKAAPDGYTLGIGSSGNLVMAPHLYTKIGYSVQRDLAPIASIAQSAYVIAVNPSVPAKTLGDFVKIARSKPNLVSYGTSGAGSTSHIGAELFRGAIGAQFVHVPYKGTGPSLLAVVAGEIDMMVADLSPALPHAKNGRLRLLATAGTTRAKAAPDVPTMAEAGVKSQTVVGRYGFVAPVGTPREIITRLNSAIVSVVKSPDIQQRLEQMGFEAVGDTPEQFTATLKTEGEVFGGVIRKAGIKTD